MKPNVKKIKKVYLRQENKENTLPFLKKFLNDEFWISLKNGEFGILTEPIFIGLSVGAGILVYFLLAFSTKSHILALITGIMSITIPYFSLKAPLLLKKKVDDALMYKDFVSVLQSCLRSTNSTAEAISLSAKEPGLNKQIKTTMENIITDLKLGDSIEQALTTAINTTPDDYLRMALTIIKINHDVGTRATIDALGNIQKSMNNVIDNIELLRDKINVTIAEKSIYLALVLASPIFITVIMNGLIGDFYSTPIGILTTLVIFAFTFFGQYLIDKKAEKAIRNI